MRRTCPARNSDRGFTFVELLAALAVAVLLAVGSASVAQTVLGARAAALRTSRLAASILALEAIAYVPGVPDGFLDGELPDGVRIEPVRDPTDDGAGQTDFVLYINDREAARIGSAAERR